MLYMLFTHVRMLLNFYLLHALNSGYMVEAKLPQFVLISDLCLV